MITARLVRQSAAALVAGPTCRRRCVSTFKPDYIAVATSTGSRAAGHGFTPEGNIDLKMGLPKEMGGNKGPAGGVANPEQLFGLAYGTCFLSALAATHSQQSTGGDGVKKSLPKDTTVRALVGVGKPGDVPGFKLAVTLEVPRGPLAAAGLEPADQDKLVAAAHELCPYSRAVRGNVDVQVKLVDE